MAWRDQLRPSTFRGVPFFVDSHTLAGGRRAMQHQYPLRDVPYVEDLGRKAGQHRLQLYVLGPDYMAARDRLLEALNAAGPATLVHPYLGSKRVVVSDVSMRESTRKGGIATFSVTFLETGEQPRPDTLAHTPTRVFASSLAADEALAESFVDSHTVDGLPEFVREDAIETVSQDLQDIWSTVPELPTGDLMSHLPSIIKDGMAVAERVQEEIKRVEGYVTGGMALVGDVQSFAAGGWQQNLLSYLEDVVPIGGLMSTYSDILGLLGGRDSASNASSWAATPSRIQQANNRQALSTLVHGIIVVSACRVAAVAHYPTADDALATRDQLMDWLDDQLDTAPDEVFGPLTDLRSEVTTDLATRGSQLARVATYTSPATLPALVLAHRIHGDARREDEIISRNRVRHPGAVPGGVPLEVLRDA